MHGFHVFLEENSIPPFSPFPSTSSGRLVPAFLHTIRISVLCNFIPAYTGPRAGGGGGHPKSKFCILAKILLSVQEIFNSADGSRGMHAGELSDVAR
jgi:hypothetical protein